MLFLKNLFTNFSYKIQNIPLGIGIRRIEYFDKKVDIKVKLLNKNNCNGCKDCDNNIINNIINKSDIDNLTKKY